MKDKDIALNIQIQYKMIEKLSTMNEELKSEILERKEIEQQLKRNLNVLLKDFIGILTTGIAKGATIT